MRKIFTVLAFFLSMVTFVHAQVKTGKITGSIKDGPQKNLQYATITLLRAKDSSSVKFSVSNKEGNFEFVNIKEGKYLVSVTLVGYEKSLSPSFKINEANSEINLGTFVLNESAKNLGGVTVSAKKPFIKAKIDKMVVNVESSKSNAAATPMEVLEK